MVKAWFGESNPYKEWIEVKRSFVKDWSTSCLTQFNDFLGMPTKGFKVEILTLLKKMKLRKE